MDGDTGGPFVLVLSAAHGMQHFFGQVFPPLIPLLATDLALPLWKLGMVVTLWALANGLTQAPVGHLADRYDRRFILPSGLAVVALGYLVVAAATVAGPALPSVTVLGATWTGTLLAVTLGMVIAGIGRGFTHPSGYPLLSANVAAGAKGKALGRWGSAAKAGDAVGPAFVGIAILLLPWEGVFAAVAGVALLAAAALFLYMTRSRLDTVPPGEDGPADGPVDWRPLVLVLLAMVLGGFAVLGIRTYLPTFITEVYPFALDLGVRLGPESVASLYFSVALLSGAVAIIHIGRLADRYPPELLMVGLYGGAAVALTALAVAPLTPVTLLLVAAVIGALLFSTSPPRDAIISRAAPGSREGRVFGYFWTALLIITATFPVLIGALGDAVGIRQGFAYLGVGPVLAVVPLLALHWMLNGREADEI